MAHVADPVSRWPTPGPAAASAAVWEITGGGPLHGEVTPGGAKNAVTKQLVATC